MGYKAMFDQKRKFGVEIEVFGVDRYELLHTLKESGLEAKIALYEDPNTDFWTLTEDGSIQGEDPVELRSPALMGTEGLLEVKKVMTLLDYLECKTNDSCGFHVHWEVRDFTGKNILALLRLYAKFEAVIDNLVAVSRREDKNQHCRSLVKDSDLSWIDNLDRTEHARALEVALKFDHNYKVKNIGNPDAAGSRNHKVNIASYFKFGTVEFRHHQGTVDIDEAVNWIIFTQLLVNKAKHASVSKEMSAKPVLGEMLRVLGLADHQESRDPWAIQCRSWLKSKYEIARGRKAGSHAGRIEGSQRREGWRDILPQESENR